MMVTMLLMLFVVLITGLVFVMMTMFWPVVIVKVQAVSKIRSRAIVVAVAMVVLTAMAAM